MDRFRDEFGAYKSTKHMFQVRYDQALPEALIRCMARETDSFW